MIYVIAELTLKPGTTEKAVAAARKAVAETNKEEGCVFYQMFSNIADPASLVLVERWKSREALSRHMETAHFKAWREAGKEFIAGRKVEIITPEKVDVP